MCVGRYDGLISQLGGLPTPAIHWAIGMEGLLLVLEAAAYTDPNGAAATLTAMKSPEVYVVIVVLRLKVLPCIWHENCGLLG